MITYDPRLNIYVPYVSIRRACAYQQTKSIPDGLKVITLFKLLFFTVPSLQSTKPLYPCTLSTILTGDAHGRYGGGFLLTGTQHS